jgi:hypothetical protein
MSAGKSGVGGGEWEVRSTQNVVLLTRHAALIRASTRRLFPAIFLTYFPPPGDTSKSARLPLWAIQTSLPPSPSASRELGELSPTPLAHPTSLALTHRRPLDQSSHPTRIHFGPLASAAKMGSPRWCRSLVALHTRQVGSRYNSELSSPTFRASSSLSSTSLAICRRPQSFILLSSSPSKQ